VKDAQVKGILVPNPCNNIVEEHESKKCERCLVGGSTPLKFHHFKRIPNKCRSLRMVVSCFEYEKSWKGLMSTNHDENPNKMR
jgi:hypothetical protein